MRTKQLGALAFFLVGCGGDPFTSLQADVIVREGGTTYDTGAEDSQDEATSGGDSATYSDSGRSDGKAEDSGQVHDDAGESDSDSASMPGDSGSGDTGTDGYDRDSGGPAETGTEVDSGMPDTYMPPQDACTGHPTCLTSTGQDSSCGVGGVTRQNCGITVTCGPAMGDMCSYVVNFMTCMGTVEGC